MKITTLIDIKNSIGIPHNHTVDDSFLNTNLEAASEMIQKYLGGKIEEASITGYKLSGRGTQRLFLPNFPVVEVDAITINDEDVLSEIEIESMRAIYREKGFPKKTYVTSLEFAPIPNWEYKNIEIDYTYGWKMPVQYPVQRVAVSNSAGDILITLAGHGYVEDDAIVISASTFPNNLTSGVYYYVSFIDVDTFSLKLNTGALEPLIAYSSAGSTVSVQKIDLEATVPKDLRYVCTKVIERIYENRAKSTDVSNSSNSLSSFSSNKSYNKQATTFFTKEERAILDQYKRVI